MREDAPKAKRLQIFMRSGNSFVIDGVTDWEMSHRDSRVTKIRLVQRTDAQYTRLIVESLDLSQIEAVLTLPEEAA